MEQAFKKILKRLEEIKGLACDGRSCSECEYTSDCLEGEMSEKVAIDKAVEIVQEVAEEFATDTNVGTNGWIACSDLLPEEYTVLCCDKYGEMIVGHHYFDEVSNTNYSSESDNEMMYNCIAWQPLPEPYKESDE